MAIDISDLPFKIVTEDGAARMYGIMITDIAPTIARLAACIGLGST